MAFGGVMFFRKSPGKPAVSNTTVQQANASVISNDNQSIVLDHIRTAIKKQTLDETKKQKVEVKVGDFFFDPTVLKIKNGTTVIWTNTGMIGHDVTGDKNSPKQGPASPLLGHGDTYSFTFDETGLYLYVCTPHPTQMRAAIEVVD